ncbi:sensor histidine kinase [Lachnoclostridium phytofermentans]|uniref:Oxygen sensor histidine kinase NreB n=1 Tax=Lachnoclostridium phytofermentans (strain ATCC 700394 / DSM 18823 / ISDg) TaxID=357809 RepID=A9KLX5_LACP7|nr:sensor histidine kinase [Lachnoclostridium phytofermentans]ABX44284.1 histidine kinase [Lachnoclostridium phytofermentans ISDg]
MEKSHKDIINEVGQTKEAMEFCYEMLKKLEEQSHKLSEKVDIVKKQKKELEHTLEKMNENQDKNHLLFSPYEDSKKIKEEDYIKKELEQLKDNLPNIINLLEQHYDLKNKYQLILSCLTNLLDRQHIDLKAFESEVCTEELINHEALGLKILEAQELERQRIAMDLHDSTVQNLTSLVHKTELCIKLFDLDAIRAKLELATMIENIRTIINDMREIIYDLRPMTLNDLGLKAAIERYVDNFKRHNKIQVIISIDENFEIKNQVVSITIYRIIQEAFNNISKHAKATTCIIDLSQKEEVIQLTIEDNGIGLEESSKCKDTTCKNCGFGLSNMSERVYLLSGKFSLESNNNSGTKIIVSIPCCIDKGD